MKFEFHNEKVNILDLRDSPWVDGPGRTILETATRINSERYGYFIGAFCKRDLTENPFVKAAIDRKLNTFQIFESHSVDTTVFLQIKHFIEREGIHIIHTHEVRSNIIGLIIGKLLGLPVITTLHGWIENGFKDKLLTRFDKSILRFFNYVITVSEKMKAQVLLNGVPKERVTALHNALVIENYQRNQTDQLFRREIGVENKTLLIANIGRLSPEKGQADFIQTAKIVLDSHHDARFLLIGIGDDELKLKVLVHELGLDGIILFLGYRSDMVNIYHSLDLVVQSSFTEGMPNVVLEALAMEVPVIATDVGGTSEAIFNNQTGILVTPGKPEEVANHISTYIQNRDLYRKMAINGRKLVEQQFGFDARTRKLSQIYDNIIYLRSSLNKASN